MSKNNRINYEEKTISSKYVYKGKVINLKEDIILLPNGKEAIRSLVEHNGGACGLALTKDKKIFFVRQFRKPFESELLELPAGKIDGNESPDETIVRELYEEIGIKVRRIEKVGIMYPTPGYTNEIIHLYFTDDFDLVENKLDDDEFLDIIKIDVNEIDSLIENGIIVDAKTLVLLLRCKKFF